MRLHRELQLTQKTAWFVLHRLRKAWSASGLVQFLDPVGIAETYVGGKETNMNPRNAKLVEAVLVRLR